MTDHHGISPQDWPDVLQQAALEHAEATGRWDTDSREYRCTLRRVVERFRQRQKRAARREGCMPRRGVYTLLLLLLLPPLPSNATQNAHPVYLGLRHLIVSAELNGTLDRPLTTQLEKELSQYPGVWAPNETPSPIAPDVGWIRVEAHCNAETCLVVHTLRRLMFARNVTLVAIVRLRVHACARLELTRDVVRLTSDVIDEMIRNTRQGV